MTLRSAISRLTTLWARLGLAVRLMAGGTVVAGLLWVGFDTLHSRRIEAMVDGNLTAELQELARQDRFRFDGSLRNHFLLARLVAGQEKASRAIQGIVSDRSPEVRQMDGAPDWLLSPGDRRLFPPIDHVVVIDAAGKWRAVFHMPDQPQGRVDSTVIDARRVALAREQTLITLVGSRPMLVSAVPVGEAVLVLMSELNSDFLLNTLGPGFNPDRAVVVTARNGGMVFASSGEIPTGQVFVVGSDWIVAGQTYLDYDASEILLSFVTLIPRSRIIELARPLLAMERSQRTMLALVMSSLFLVVLTIIVLRLRRLANDVARVTEETFGVTVPHMIRGDELSGLINQVRLLSFEVITSRSALQEQTRQHIRLATEQAEARAEVDRLKVMQGVTELLGIGVIMLTEDGPVAENAVMERIAAGCRGLLPFVDVAARGEGEIAILCSDGGERIFEVTYGTGIEPGMLLVVDVTEKRHAEAQIRTFAQFPAQNPLPVFRIDAQGILTHANLASRPLLDDWHVALGQRLPEPWASQALRVMRDGRPAEATVTVGSTVLALYLVPVKGERETYTNIYGHNVTDRVAAERQLLAVNDWLDRRVTERTADLMAAKEIAEIANRSKTEFLASISHELRTPLNAIIGFAEIMVSGLFGKLENKRYQDYVVDIHNSGRHLLQVINDILDISRIEAGQVDLHVEPVEVADVVGSATRLVESRAQGGGLDLSVDLPADLPEVEADRRRLLQILVNLLSNAVKFTPSGGSVRIAAERDEERVVIRIIDTGIGMDEPEIEVALQMFRQVDGSLSRGYEGTGLGLPLARSFSEMLGGKLEIVSAKGKGTTVSVSLPVSAGNLNVEVA